MAHPSADSPMRLREARCKSVTRLRGAVDPWFLGRYGMNLYRGCAHGCLYCDGRAERYFVAGDFARDVEVKVNALEVLGAELARVPEPGFVFLGGGVCDAYQPAEERYRLARGALELALRHRLPVHVLTKSALVERDLDLLERLAAQSRAILSFSVQTLDEQVRARFEPGAAPIAERLRLLAQARRRGIAAGAMVMPVLPGISDRPEDLDLLFAALREAGADFALCGGLTLRPGAQMQTWLAALAASHPLLLDGYRRAWRAQAPSGAPEPRYLARLEERFAAARARHAVPGRIPRALFRGVVPLYAEVAVLLEHLESERRAAGRPSPGLARAGFALQLWARRRLAVRGRSAPSWREVESELLARAADGSLGELEGISPAALAEIRTLLGERRAR